MQFLTTVHEIFFNAILWFSGFLAVWGIVTSARNRGISGGFWGAVALLTGLAAITTLIGVILALRGYNVVELRNNVYFLYMAWLVIIMPGMFAQLRGRDDSSAALAFALLAVFNLFVGLSIQSRGLVTWLPIA
ncbi:MAG: hypothetical protein ACOYL5_06245 [Phototrophicaceae bacterium]|jgi:hypothetical protein